MFILLNIQQKDWNECLKMFILPPVGARVIGSLHTHTHTHTHTHKKKKNMGFQELDSSTGFASCSVVWPFYITSRVSVSLSL
jgi:hypothetical protein